MSVSIYKYKRHERATYRLFDYNLKERFNFKTCCNNSREWTLLAEVTRMEGRAVAQKDAFSRVVAQKDVLSRKRTRCRANRRSRKRRARQLSAKGGAKLETTLLCNYSDTHSALRFIHFVCMPRAHMCKLTARTHTHTHVQANV